MPRKGSRGPLGFHGSTLPSQLLLFCAIITSLHSKGLGRAAMPGTLTPRMTPYLAWVGPSLGRAHKSVHQIQAEHPPRHLDPPSLDSPSQGPADTLAGAFC